MRRIAIRLLRQAAMTFLLVLLWGPNLSTWEESYSKIGTLFSRPKFAWDDVQKQLVYPRYYLPGYGRLP